MKYEKPCIEIVDLVAMERIAQFDLNNNVELGSVTDKVDASGGSSNSRD